MKLFRCLVLLALLALLAPAMPARALDPTRSVTQYKHSRWGWDPDTPSPIFSIDQDRHGYLWIGAGDGLYRFDGVRFEKIELEGTSEKQGSALPVLVARNGDVWTWFARSKRFAVYRNGALRAVTAPEVDGQVTRMVQTADGAIWAGIGDIGRPLLRFQNGRWESLGADRGVPRDQLLGMVVAADGALWVSYINSVQRLAPGARKFEQMLATPGASGTITPDPQGRIWLTDKTGSRPITGPGGRGSPPPLRVAYPTDPSGRRGRPVFDRDGNMWIARRSDGIERVRVPDPAGAPTAAAAAAQIERYHAIDGLTSDRTSRIFEDREGNIWIGTSLGLDRFRPTSVAVEPALTKPGAYGDLLLAASDGAVYVTQADAIYRIAPGGAPEPFMTGTGEPEAICEAPDGTIWIALSDRIVGRPKSGGQLQRSRPKAETGIYDCAVDSAGELWVTAAEDGAYRYRAGRWLPVTDPAGGDEFHPTKMIRDAQGRLIMLWGPRTISWIDGARRRSVTIPGKQSTIDSFFESPRGLLAVGDFGVARVANGRTQILLLARIPAVRRSEGIIETPQGEIWMMRNEWIIRTTVRELDRAFSDPRYKPVTTIMDYYQGLPDLTTGEVGRGMVRGGDGRIWVATSAGTVWFDPARIARNAVAPGLVISALKVDGKSYRDPRTLSLGSGPGGIEIDFAVLSLALPELNKVRYRLEGVDKEWVDPGPRRQAFYTNLAPGKYRFQVIAANNDGVWNRTGATVEFEIAPTFFQSIWFMLLCVILGLVLIWGLFQLRIRQIAWRIRRRIEERHAEREHIARELHDTLLQGVQGLVLRFQAAANAMPSRARSRGLLEDALDRADDLIEEARDSVRALRGREDPGDLQCLISEMVETTLDPATAVRIVVEGKPRAIHPHATDEVSRIVREALFNIARHAEARWVRVDIGFGPQQLAIRIRDDGLGIPAEVLARGHVEGHFGLVGMRERAEKLGGTLTIDSVARKGTDVTLTLPARLAYVADARKRFAGIPWPLFPRWNAAS